MKHAGTPDIVCAGATTGSGWVLGRLLLVGAWRRCLGLWSGQVFTQRPPALGELDPAFCCRRKWSFCNV
ncbi:hypothetical protein LI036_02390 [bacterium 210917-DFI.7.65]|nr:hypothetical protein [bacterium 210917-DFI.7.65]